MSSLIGKSKVVTWPGLLGAVVLAAALTTSSFAQIPEFNCSAAAGTEVAGELQDNIITIDGQTGDVFLTAAGGCALPSAGVPDEDRLGVASWSSAPSEVSANSPFQMPAPLLGKIMLPDGPANVTTRYILTGTSGTFPVAAGDGWTTAFTVPLPQQSFAGIPAGVYELRLAARRGAAAIPVDQLLVPRLVEVKAGEPNPNPLDPPPTHWEIDTTQTYQQGFGVAFPTGSGVREVNVNTRVDLSSPTGMKHGVKSYRFTVGGAGLPTFGRFSGVTGSLGGTPWFFISEGAPGDLALLRNGASFTYTCATAGTGYIPWMVEGTALPVGTTPSAANRCKLKVGTNYYLNVLFVHLQKVINTPASYSGHNTCIRPGANPTEWPCQARFNNQQTQSQPDEPASD